MLTQDQLVEVIIQKVIERLTMPTCYIYGSETDEALKKIIEGRLENRVKFVSNIQQADIILLATTSIHLLAELAAGYGSLPEVNLILEQLASGKRVSVIEEGIIHRKYKETCPEKLYQKWCHYETEVSSYGIDFISQYHLEDALILKKTMDKSDRQQDEKANETVEESLTLEDQLVTEKTLSRRSNLQIKKINLSKKAIVTPLAQDYIREERIEIKRL